MLLCVVGVAVGVVAADGVVAVGGVVGGVGVVCHTHKKTPK